MRMTRIALKSLRVRWTSLTGAFVALALGVALTAAMTLGLAGVPDLPPGPDAVVLYAVLGTAGGVSTFVSAFVVASTYAYVVAQRRRELGLLRLAGATPAQVRRTVLVEALLLGAAASGLGCALGQVGAPRLARWLTEVGMAPPGFTVGTASWPLYAAFWTGLLVALGSVATAARRAGRVGPLDALREADVDTGVMTAGRWFWGLGLLLPPAPPPWWHGPGHRPGQPAHPQELHHPADAADQRLRAARPRPDAAAAPGPGLAARPADLVHRTAGAGERGGGPAPDGRRRGTGPGLRRAGGITGRSPADGGCGQGGRGPGAERRRLRDHARPAAGDTGTRGADALVEALRAVPGQDPIGRWLSEGPLPPGPDQIREALIRSEKEASKGALRLLLHGDGGPPLREWMNAASLQFRLLQGDAWGESLAMPTVKAENPKELLLALRSLRVIHNQHRLLVVWGNPVSRYGVLEDADKVDHRLMDYQVALTMGVNQDQAEWQPIVQAWTYIGVVLEIRSGSAVKRLLDDWELDTSRLLDTDSQTVMKEHDLLAAIGRFTVELRRQTGPLVTPRQIEGGVGRYDDYLASSGLPARMKAATAAKLELLEILAEVREAVSDSFRLLAATAPQVSNSYSRRKRVSDAIGSRQRRPSLRSRS